MAEQIGFVLRETLASKQQGRPMWFAKMTAIGPMTTSEPAERAVFATREEAALSPAMMFTLTFFEVEDA